MDYVVDRGDPPVEETMRHYVQENYPGGLPENLIALPFISALRGLQYLKTQYPGCQPEVNAGRICFYMGPNRPFPQSFRLAYSSERLQMQSGIEGPVGNPDVGIWGVGIAFLEMVYGRMPANLTPNQLYTIGRNMVRIMRPKVELGEEEIKKLPTSLELLLNEAYVRERERKLIQKNKSRGIMRFVRYAEGSFWNSSFLNPGERKRSTRTLLEPLMLCLDQDNPRPMEEIMRHSLFQGL